ncbi:putative villin/Gelsolin, ADF-H/Gelsolin-like domain superfamily [Helianthus annuus]|nr:putative villin/Gelsolin, ADF-H/Gelsolin-like domain superfamily [Helianthus annuus]KAJ0542042.1 putative villin/Gelsolin, ADF-H/Gelsolin-like domain superfamily [Helianthus annuus]KAJ0707106.1 putative villin/Gelsolin, ADF-H/Gelsolin-like domain superfamily [Helianthus annuus]KAJ0711125.1 putative villin/Gelsolin, ADF-H/Gelsolin-like domain superfamily [Helianthus annuus]
MFDERVYEIERLILIILWFYNMKQLIFKEFWGFEKLGFVVLGFQPFRHPRGGGGFCFVDGDDDFWPVDLKHLMMLVLAQIFMCIDGGKVGDQIEEYSKSSFETDKCYLMDCGFEVFVWVGRATQVDDRKAATQAAEAMRHMHSGQILTLGHHQPHLLLKTEEKWLKIEDKFQGFFFLSWCSCCRSYPRKKQPRSSLPSFDLGDISTEPCKFLTKHNSSSNSHRTNRFPEGSPSNGLQRQLQQLFHLHDSGLDQTFIDDLPVFMCNKVVGANEPFDYAVCLCEFSENDKLRLLQLTAMRSISIV